MSPSPQVTLRLFYYTPVGTICQEYLAVFTLAHAPGFCLQSPTRQSGATAARCSKSAPPEATKTSPMSPPRSKSETKFRFASGGDMGEVRGGSGRFGGREPHLSRGGSLPPRSSFPPLPPDHAAGAFGGANAATRTESGIDYSEIVCNVNRTRRTVLFADFATDATRVAYLAYHSAALR